jgi:hypothetical protein
MGADAREALQLVAHGRAPVILQHATLGATTLQHVNLYKRVLERHTAHDEAVRFSLCWADHGQP